ncbi:unnamed protein product [Parnassius mnemosyne]|uniref:THAP-type domain-containing protein n=1 Tax=Parnassius mnemosyne TaxID=213953 RepID=A0AAV1M064_9NEOP
MKNTCCVPHCESKRRNFKLHCFPKTEIGLKWVEKINCEKLKQLSAEELHKFFVCHKHFEARFVTGSLRLRHFAYPTLFTADEINTGIPALEMENYENQNVFYDHDYTQARKRHHEDHSYFKTQPLKSQDYNEPPSIYKHFKMTEKIAVCLHHDKAANMPSTSKDFEKTACDQNNQQPTIPDLPQFSNVVTSKKCIRKNTTRNKKISPSYLRILNELKKAKKQLSFAKRAMKFSKKENFEKLTCNLKPLAKKIIWMQIMQSGKHSKGWRFSDEEKMIALAIMKQSPKSYRFLRRIFILPSIRTINKLINKLKMDSRINPHIFKAIKTEVANWQESKNIAR